MAKLILSVDGTVLQEFPLTKERMTVGRKPHNEIQVDNLAVSGEHAVIITILNDSFVEDLNSTNGTLVNGKPIKKHFLQNNDVIEVGKHKLKYFNDAPVAAAAQDFEKTMIIRKAPSVPSPNTVQMPDMPVVKAPTLSSDTQANLNNLNPPGSTGVMPALTLPGAPPLPMAPTYVPPTPPAPPPAAPLAFNPVAPSEPSGPAAPAAPTAPAAAHATYDAAIQVLLGAAAGRTLDLVKNLTTIGKPGVQVAVITRRPNGFFITHVEGKTYPTVNGIALGPQAQQLADHDLIEIAGVKMEFFFKQ